MKFGQYKFPIIIIIIIIIIIYYYYYHPVSAGTHNNMQYYYYAQTFFHDFEKGNKMVFPSARVALPVCKQSLNFIYYGVTDVA